jgi:hypothetical protein
MNTIAAKEDENFSNAAFKAVIIYDDIGQASRAAASLERATADADPAMNCDLKLWRVEALRQPTQAAICMAVAADANLVLFALNERHPPRKALLNWLKDWAANRTVHEAAVTLLGPLADAATPLRNEIEYFARRHGLAFLGVDETSDIGPAPVDFGPQPDWGKPAEPGSPPMLEPAPATSHWGINE